MLLSTLHNYKRKQFLLLCKIKHLSRLTQVENWTALATCTSVHVLISDRFGLIKAIYTRNQIFYVILLIRFRFKYFQFQLTVWMFERVQACQYRHHQLADRHCVLGASGGKLSGSNNRLTQYSMRRVALKSANLDTYISVCFSYKI